MNNYGECDFTLNDFLALTLYLEFADTPAEGKDDFTQAVAYKLACQAAASGACRGAASSYSATLNYVGSRGVMRSRYGDWRFGGQGLADLTQQNRTYNLEQAASMAASAIAMGPQLDLEHYTGPWDWGNLSMFPEVSWRPMLEIEDAEFSLAVDSVVYLWGKGSKKPENAFVIVTYAQNHYWKETYPNGLTP